MIPPEPRLVYGRVSSHLAFLTAARSTTTRALRVAIFARCHVIMSAVLSASWNPYLPSPAKRRPAGPGWIHEIKHDGYRLMIWRDGERDVAW
jgi:ATP-dependent DNA ligase